MTGKVIIQAVPDRLEYVQSILVPRLSEDGIPVEIVVDENLSGAWFTHKRCLEMGQDSTWFLIIQDDVYPCLDIPAACSEIYKHPPGVPICLYAHCVEVYRASPGVSLTVRPWKVGHVAAPAILYAGEWVHDFLQWESQTIPTDLSDPWWGRPESGAPFAYWGANSTPEQRWHAYRHWDDWRLKLYQLHIKKPIFFTAPSLVQHMGVDSMVKPGKKTPAKAKWYIGGDKSALSLDWSNRDWW